jgi:argininosuccinate lyase
MQHAVTGLVVNEHILQDKRYNDIFSVEEANRMVLEGVPFREAYRAVAGKTGSGLFNVPTLAGYSHTGSIGNTGFRLIRTRLEQEMEAFRTGCSPEELLEKLLSLRNV